MNARLVIGDDHGYAGQPISRAYHLLQAGHGGQILLTVTTEELVRDRLPGGVTLRHLGEHRRRATSIQAVVRSLNVTGLEAEAGRLLRSL